MNAPRTVAVIGFGEAGTVVAEGCLSGARRLGQETACHAWDIRMADPAQRPLLQRAADARGVILHDAPGDWLRDMDVVFSLVFGGAARDVALQMLPFLGAGAAYIDLTTSVPGDMREAEAAFLPRQVDFIDGTALGSFRTNGITVPFVLSGNNVAARSAWMNSLGFVTRPVPGPAGNASCVKLLRSVVTKGMEALAIECFVAAERMGLRETMMESFGDMDLRPLVKNLEDMGSSHIPHCRRRLAEIDHALRMLRSVNVAPTMTEASRLFYARTVDAGKQLGAEQAASWDGCLPSLGEVLAAS